MKTSSSEVLVVGASVGGIATARALRSYGHRGSITIVSNEASAPYDKPPLSKQFLCGEQEVSDFQLLPREEMTRMDLRVRYEHEAQQLDPSERTVSFSGERRLPYDHLVIATGASASWGPWKLAVPGIHVLRTLTDGQALRDDLRKSRQIVVIGCGVLGTEIASSAATTGCQVTIVDSAATPIHRILDREAGQRLIHRYENYGVDCLFKVKVTSITGSRGDFRLILDSGEVLRADIVVLSIGASPNDGWLTTSGLLVDDGVVCDEYCRAAGMRNVYAVGDVTRWFRRRNGMLTRLEHWTNAVDQADIVAWNILHSQDRRSYDPTPYVWSDQFGFKIQAVGDTGCGVPGIIKSITVDDQKFAHLYQAGEDGYLTGAVTVNWPRALIACRKGIAERVVFEQAVDVVQSLR